MPLHQRGEVLHRGVGVRVADVEDLVVSTRVLENRRERRRRILDVGEATMLPATIDEIDRPTGEHRRQEVGEHAWTALGAGRDEVVEPGAHEVERPDDRVVEIALDAVRIDNALEQLLRGCIDPTLLLHGSHDEIRVVIVVLLVACPLPVDLGGRVLDQTLLMAKAILENLHVLEEVELDDLQRRFNVDAGVGVGDEVDDDVGFRNQLVGQISVS